MEITRSKAIGCLMLSILVTCAFGCAAPTVHGPNGDVSIAFGALGPKYIDSIPSPGHSKIFVYSNADEGPGSTVQPEVLVGGKSIGTLEPSGYLAIDLDPGDVTVAVQFRETRKVLEVRLSPGESKYFRFKPTGSAYASKAFTTSYQSVIHFEEVSGESAKQELVLTRLSVPVNEAPEQIAPTTPKGRIIVIRPWTLIGNEEPAELFVNANSRGAINGDSAIECVVPSGKVSVALRWSNSIQREEDIFGAFRQYQLVGEFAVAEGTVTYVQVDFVPFQTQPTFALRALSSNDGEKAFAKYKDRPKP